MTLQGPHETGVVLTLPTPDGALGTVCHRKILTNWKILAKEQQREFGLVVKAQDWASA